MMGMFEDIFGKGTQGRAPGKPEVHVVDMTMDSEGNLQRTGGAEQPELPPHIREMISGIFGRMAGQMASQSSDEDHPLLAGLKRRKIFRAPTAAEITEFLDFEELKVGDIVTHRGKEFEAMVWPEGLESAVVVRTFAPQFVMGSDNIHIDKHSLRDCTLMVMQNMDPAHEAWVAETEGREPHKPMYVEVSFDSRRLKKIGSIYDAKA